MKPSRRDDEDFDWQAQVGAPSFRLRPRHPRLAIWLGLLISQFAGLGGLALVTLVFSDFNWNRLGDLGGWTAGILGFSQFLLIPFGMGMIAAYFWLDVMQIAAKDYEPKDLQTPRKERPRVGTLSFFNTLLSLFGAFFVLREGTICLIMAAPILWLSMHLGILTGDHFWRKTPFLRVSLAPIFLLLVWGEASWPQSQVFQVSTQFHSKATPAQLWRYSAQYPRNPNAPRWWLHRIGLPAPMECTGQAQVGGRRDCVLSGNVEVGEKIVVAQPNRRLDFVIDEQPQHPEVTRHLVLLRGRIELLPDGRGGTIIRGTSFYRLNVAPTAFFQLWSDEVMRQTHRRVFAWMDELAQTNEEAVDVKISAVKQYNN